MSIKKKLILSYIFLIIFSVSVIGYQIENKSNDVIFREVTEKSERITELINNMVSVRNDLLTEKVWSDMYFAQKLLNDLGEIRIDKTEKKIVENKSLPSLYVGDINLTMNSSFVDEIGESVNAIVSIFLFQDDKLFRVSTNDTSYGERIFGSYISNDSPIYKSIINNRDYNGRSLILDKWYFATYKPFLDADNNIVGAISLGYQEINSYLEETLNNIKVGETGYVYIMNSNGEAIIHPSIKGQNLKSYDFSKEIINKKNGVIEYEFNGIKKLASYKYFQPYDWYIVTTANYNDLKSSSQTILKTTIYVGIITIIIAIIFAILLAETLIRPINKLKAYMKVASKGDLTVHSDIKSKDEIGILSDSFNIMIKENKRLLEEIVKYDEIKTEFFSNISHELKTPLNIIFSISQLFSVYINDEKNFDYSKMSNYIDNLKQNCYRLLRLVNNLIDITKIDSGFMELNLKNLNIVEIVEDITLSTVEYIQNKQRIIIFDTDIEEKIMAIDADKMERIILNLISNAVKFTEPDDKIQVTISDKKDNILISVKDSGIGIPKEKQNSIFERFKQVNPLFNRNHEGSGIGLSLVKDLVEMHNGNITINSEYGKGTEFLISLPVNIISDEDNTKTPHGFTQQSNVEKIQIEFSDIYK